MGQIKMHEKGFKLFLIFLLAFAVRFGMNAVFQGLNSPPDPNMGGDHLQYDIMARNLSKGVGCFTEEDESGIAEAAPTVFQPPGTAFLLFLVYSFSGVNYAFARIAFCLIGAATCVVVFFIAKRIMNQRMGILASFILAIYPMHFYYSMHFFSETPYAFFISLAILSLIIFEEGGKATSGVLAGIFIGCSALIKPQGICYPFFYMALAFASYFKRDKIRFLKLALVPLLLMISTIAPWTIRSYKVAGHFIPISVNGGITFWGSHNEIALNDPELTGGWVAPARLPEAAEFYSYKTSYEQSRAAYGYGFDFIKSHLKDMPKLGMMKLYRLVTPFYGTENRIFNIVGGLSWALLSIFVLLGILFSLRNPRFISLHSAVLMTLFTTIVFYGDHRFRESISPILVVYACAGLRGLGFFRR